MTAVRGDQLGDASLPDVARARAGIAELERRRTLARRPGRPDADERLRAAGFLTPDERVDRLLDPGSVLHFGRLVHSDDAKDVDRTFGDGELSGFGTIGGRPVAFFAADPRVKGGTPGGASMRHAAAFRAVVEKAGLPLFFLMQAGGGRITDILSSRFLAAPGAGLASRRAFGRRGALLTAVLGGYYAPWTVAQSDFSVMTRSSNLSLTSPVVIEASTGTGVSEQELGGADVHARETGQIDAVSDDDCSALDKLREVFSYLPGNVWERAPLGSSPDRLEPDAGLVGLVPANRRAPYDMRAIIARVVDQRSFLEWSPEFAPNVITGLARIAGSTVVIVASQPSQRAGVIDVAALRKLKRILTLARDFSLPMVSLVDTPGVLPTKEEERQRILTELYEVSVLRLQVKAPRVSVIVRKAVGFALFVLGAGDPEAISYAWPGAEISFMGALPGIRVAYRRELAAAADRGALEASLVAEAETHMQPWTAAHLGLLDDVIDPACTRPAVVRALMAQGRT